MIATNARDYYFSQQMYHWDKIFFSRQTSKTRIDKMKKKKRSFTTEFRTNSGFSEEPNDELGCGVCS